MTLSAVTAVLLFTLGADPTPVPPPPPGAPPPPASMAPAQDPRALALVKRMCDRLQQARTFTVKGRVSLELPVAGGILATFVNEMTASLQRPDRLAAARGGDLAEIRFAYDGSTMSIYTPSSGLWGTAAAPPTIDAMLLAAGEQGSLSFPFDEILVADPYSAITRDLTQATLVGQSTVGGKKTDHLVLAGPTLELQLWIDASTGLPARAVAVYADHPLRPHFAVDYTEWRLDPKLPAATFALPRPAGAAQVEFRAAAAAFR